MYVNIFHGEEILISNDYFFKNFQIRGIIKVHGKTIYEWHTGHTGDILVHLSDIRSTCEYIREHTSDIRKTYRYIRVAHHYIRVHVDNIRAHMSDIQTIYQYIRVTCEWHVSGIRVRTIEIRMTYKGYANDKKKTLDCIKDLVLLDHNLKYYLWQRHCYRWL